MKSYFEVTFLHEQKPENEGQRTLEARVRVLQAGSCLEMDVAFIGFDALNPFTIAHLKSNKPSTQAMSFQNMTEAFKW